MMLISSHRGDSVGLFWKILPQLSLEVPTCIGVDELYETVLVKSDFGRYRIHPPPKLTTENYATEDLLSSLITSWLGLGGPKRQQTLFSQPGIQVPTLLGRVEDVFHNA